jgi:probable F420-dependent oxidoreductase
MKLGIYLRNMGPQSTRDTILECARIADDSELDDLWVADHVAIPPDQAEGSDGRYLDPLPVLAFLAAATRRIGLGIGVLILPYRPLLPTAKWIATIQELSGNRLRLGVGAGWMAEEFRALGIDRRRRDELTDATLEGLVRMFASDVVEENGQPFLFRPRPPQPPIYVGGSSPRALRRTVRFGDAWMPAGGDASSLAPKIRRLREEAQSAGRTDVPVVALTALPLDDVDRAIEHARSLAAAGVSHVVHAERYADARAFGDRVETLTTRICPAVA